MDFNPREFEHTIINRNFAIQGQKIFYLYDCAEEPFPEGIFESEDLIEPEDRSRPKFANIKGPFLC